MKKIILILLALARCACAETITINENFAGNPATDGWQTYGTANLFQWDSTNHNLAVKWDSSQPNSYYYHPIGTFLTSGDDFTLSFDLLLKDATIFNNTFELAEGLLHFSDATSPGYLRGTGFNITNDVEFDYFMDPVFGNSLAASEFDETGLFADVYDNTPLSTNTTYHITVSNVAGSSLISAQVTSGGQLVSSLSSAFILPGYDDFRVDTIAIMSYSDQGAYGNASILAHGTIANLAFTATTHPVAKIKAAFNGPAWQVQFTSRTNWVYTLERSDDLKTWQPAAPTAKGTDQLLILQDTNLPTTRALYRVKATQ